MRHAPAQSGSRRGELWTVRQRVALIGILSVIVAVVVVRQWNRPALLPDPPPPAGRLAEEVQNRIDPNVAPLDHLSVLPGIGAKRAAAIIAYREMFRRQHDARPPFQRAEDLAHVKGIGVATVENLRPYLMFGREDAHP